MSLGLAPAGASGTHNTITFASSGATPVAPLAAGGAIVVDAKTIVQGGALYAPLGTIQLGFGSGQSLPGVFTAFGSGSDPYDPLEQGSGILGLFGSKITTVATGSMTLLPGSLTSVSAVGLTIPYGSTTDGTNWAFNNTLLNGPPAKLIVLGGTSVKTLAGATIDGRGGGEVYASEFVPGTGGSRNVLTTTTQTVYALVPGYASSLAPSDPTFATKVAAGQTVTIPGGNGIPGGTYTLLPAEYATLPGAYRVVVGSASTNPVGQDDHHHGRLRLYDGRARQFDQRIAFIADRAAADPVEQRLDQILRNRHRQGRQLLRRAGRKHRRGGAAARSGCGAHGGCGRHCAGARRHQSVRAGAGGLGGQLDITGTNLVVAATDQLGNFGTVTNGAFTANSAYAGYLFLDPDMLSQIGIESILLGGYRSNTTEGTRINATAANLEVATDAAHALSGTRALVHLARADEQRAPSVHGVVVDTGSVIIARGAVADGSTSGAGVWGRSSRHSTFSSGTLTG